jgi:tRNA U55 pseudouridine synthase TruB
MMQSLRRTWVGEPGQAFTLDEAHTIDELRERAAKDTLSEVVLPLTTAIAAWPQVHLDTAQTARIRHGQFVAVAELNASALKRWPPRSQDTPVALIEPSGNVCAVARLRDDNLRPVKVFTTNDE